MTVRLVITGHRDGKAAFVSDEALKGYEFQAVPGMVQNSLWATEKLPKANCAGNKVSVNSLIPPPGGTRLSVVTIAPDSVVSAPTFDSAAMVEELGRNLPGLAETFEPDKPGMHRTATLDYVIVLSGNVVLELDDGVTKELKPFDIVVQNGTRHAWRNPSSEPATLAVVMTGQQAI
ncbi:cupin domain-containing protein [Paraburkholderia aspalathi]|nr:cupin domain-containing protein [Paraburkholderia aspalathi]